MNSVATALYTEMLCNRYNLIEFRSVEYKTYFQLNKHTNRQWMKANEHIEYALNS